MEKRKFKRMIGIQIKELFQREKVEEVEIKKGKNNKAHRKDESRGSNIYWQHSRNETEKKVTIHSHNK